MRDILVTADEDKFGVKYRAEADWKVLGQKLKKDAQKVKKALPSLTSEQVKEFVKNKEMVVDGIKVTDEDLNVSAFFPLSDDDDDRGPAFLADRSILLSRLFATLIRKTPITRQTLIVMCLSCLISKSILNWSKKVLHVKLSTASSVLERRPVYYQPMTFICTIESPTTQITNSRPSWTARPP